MGRGFACGLIGAGGVLAAAVCVTIRRRDAQPSDRATAAQVDAHEARLDAHDAKLASVFATMAQACAAAGIPVTLPPGHAPLRLVRPAS